MTSQYPLLFTTMGLRGYYSWQEEVKSIVNAGGFQLFIMQNLTNIGWIFSVLFMIVIELGVN